MVSLKGKALTEDQLQLDTIYFPRYTSNDTNVQLNFDNAAIQEFTENGKFASDCALVTGVPSTNSTNRSLAVTSLVPLPNSGEQNQKVGVLNVSTKQSPTGSNRTPEMLYSLSTPSGEVYQLYFEELVLQKYSDLSIFNNKPIFTSGEDYSKRWGAKSNNRFVTELTPLKSAQPVKLTGKFQEFQHGDYGYCLSIHVGTFNLGFKDVTGKSYPLVLKENDYGVDLRKAETITINADYYATEDGKGAILYLKSVD
jgi:hypothetical protein